jgi:hypothetical protein
MKSEMALLLKMPRFLCFSNRSKLSAVEREYLASGGGGTTLAFHRDFDKGIFGAASEAIQIGIRQRKTAESRAESQGG